MEFALYPGVMKQMLNIFFATISYTAYLMLALFQTPSVTDLGSWKDVGLGTAFICAFFWMFRYFTGHIEKLEAKHAEQLAKKDEKIEKLTQDVLEISRNAIAVQTISNGTNGEIIGLLKSLDAKI